MNSWSTADIPSQRGKLAVVTGATGGLGYETALALAARRGRGAGNRQKRREGTCGHRAHQARRAFRKCTI